MDTHKSWEKTAATLRQIVDLRGRVKELEKALAGIQNNAVGVNKADGT